MKSLNCKTALCLWAGISLMIIGGCTPKMASSDKPIKDETVQETNANSDPFSRIEPKEQTATSKELNSPYPPVMIYKTKRNMTDRVPVILNDDRSAIVSYPDVKDVYYKGELAYPLALCNGYWLDQRGINQRVAFLDYTYEEYSKLGTTPLPEVLMLHIYDKDPLVVLYSCRCQRDTAMINEMIRSGELKNCQRLK